MFNGNLYWSPAVGFQTDYKIRAASFLLLKKTESDRSFIRVNVCLFDDASVTVARARFG